VTIEGVRTGTLTRSQTVFMVTALVLSVVSFMLNATMLSPGIRDINTQPRSVSADRSDSRGPGRLSVRGRKRPITQRCGSRW
jgi:hypothetical protein